MLFPERRRQRRSDAASILCGRPQRSGAEPERGREFFNERYVLLDIRNCRESQRDSHNQSTAVWPGTADFCSRGTTEAGRSRKRSVFCARRVANAAFLCAPEVFKGGCAGRRTFRGVDRRGFGGDFGRRFDSGGSRGVGRGGCGVERCRDERAAVAGGRAKPRAGKIQRELSAPGRRALSGRHAGLPE